DEMIDAALVCTLPIALVMLEVVSARKMTSGSTGIGGVSTVFATVVLSPGKTVAVTWDGVTPGAARAAAAVTWTMTRTAPSAARLERDRRLSITTPSIAVAWSRSPDRCPRPAWAERPTGRDHSSSRQRSSGSCGHGSRRRQAWVRVVHAPAAGGAQAPRSGLGARGEWPARRDSNPRPT